MFTPHLDKQDEATTDDSISKADSTGNQPGGISDAAPEHGNGHSGDEKQGNVDVEKSESTVDINGAISTSKASNDPSTDTDAPSPSIGPKTVIM